jgi:ATP-dependent Clp protease ATP-binding subunit ClpA
VLQKYCHDLTALAKEGKLDPVIGRDAEMRRTIEILSRRTKNNPVLLGEVSSDMKASQQEQVAVRPVCAVFGFPSAEADCWVLCAPCFLNDS